MAPNGKNKQTKTITSSAQRTKEAKATTYVGATNQYQQKCKSSRGIRRATAGPKDNDHQLFVRPAVISRGCMSASK